MNETLVNVGYTFGCSFRNTEFVSGVCRTGWCVYHVICYTPTWTKVAQCDDETPEGLTPEASEQQYQRPQPIDSPKVFEPQQVSVEFRRYDYVPSLWCI